MEQATPRSLALQQLIAAFIGSRLNDKQQQTAESNTAAHSTLTQEDVSAWLAKAVANLRSQKKNPLRLATHPAKATHSATEGSSIFSLPSSLPRRLEIGSHDSPDDQVDAVGNAAVLGIYKFLLLDFGGESLLSLLNKADQDLLSAFGVDSTLAEDWRTEFCKVLPQTVTHHAGSLSKQIYWPVSPDNYPADATDDSHYHLLSILNSSALSHWLYGRIQEHRFGDAAKAARQAKRDGSHHPHGYHDYPQLAEEKKGGTKPQNISQLNSERRGSNYLLASLPPQWDSSETQPLYHLDNAFRRFGQRKAVRSLLREFGQFLGKLKPEHNTIHIRQRRENYLAGLFGELLQFGAAYSNALPPGWTDHPDCQLPLAQQCWLDPYRAGQDADFNLQFQWQDWPQQLAEDFAHWLNSRLEGKNLHLAETEFDFWRRQLAQDAGWQGQLDHLQQGAPA
ncbi:type I-F CRISPR-associated protein Csy1 [Aquitalea magnusonii]|uniref:CRISPR-associated Csy1 family protein n=1 Tax=Aquitalea magnusonii TaxID=332411 RepID=A0A318JLX3_9NEIS|nr:type I-F CRISPR-associated protein Csy1 [Aquitalea magnusonii]PXX50960.1 CRISPR-associated Csy1 family protein [Aquitalea magnusonii]